MTQLHELHEYFRISIEKSSFYFKYVFQNTHNHNKAISDGKYLAPQHASNWQRSPH